MINRVKRLYLTVLLNVFYDKKVHGHRPNAIGRAVLPFLPMPWLQWQSGIFVKPSYLHRLSMLRSLQGQHEPSLEHFTQLVLRAGDTCLDVGAQIGLTVVMAASCVGPAGRVIALEPDQYNHAVLTEVLRLNRLSQVDVRNIAVGSEAGEASFSDDYLSGLTQVSASENGARLVQVTTIDQLVHEGKISQLRMIKIDVDGPDLLVLYGAKKTIASLKPAIAVECSRFWQRFGHRFEDAWRFLHDLGYVIAVGVRSSEKFRIIADPVVLPSGWGVEKGRAINMYCLHPEVHSDLLREFEGDVRAEAD